MAARLANLTAPRLAISVSDDPFGTIVATERLADHGVHRRVTHGRIAPERIGVDAIGHCAFSYNRVESTRWPLVLHRLREATLPAGVSGEILRRPPRVSDPPLRSDAIR